MTLSRTRLLYIAAMLVSGIVIGLFVAWNPALANAMIPPIAWPIAVSLVLDLIIMQAAANGKAEPLTMTDRAIGVIGAGLIITILMAQGSA